MTGFKTVVRYGKGVCIEELNITVPVALHLDHGTYEGCYKCIRGRLLLYYVRRISLSDRGERCKDKRTCEQSAMRKEFLLKQKLVLSVEKKTALSEWASAQILRNAR